MKRWIRVCAWIVISLVTAVCLFREYVDWSGARRWADVRAMLAREGESIDFRTLAREPVPDEENFCAIPALKDIALLTGTTDLKSELGEKESRLRGAEIPIRRAPDGRGPSMTCGVDFGTPVNLEMWAALLREYGMEPAPKGITDPRELVDYGRPLPMPANSGNPARDLVMAFSRDDALVDDLAAGLDRPDSQLTPAWKTRDLPEPLDKIELPHYTDLRSLMPMLTLRSIAAANAGDTSKASLSLQVAIRITQAMMNEPLLIGGLIGTGFTALDTDAIWEMCKTHTGSAEDFQKMEDGLASIDLQATYLNEFRTALAMEIDSVEHSKESRGTALLDLINQTNGTSASNGSWIAGLWIASLLGMVPGGWYDGNTATLSEWYLHYIIEPLRDGNLNTVILKEKELTELIEKTRAEAPYRHYSYLLAWIVMPSFTALTNRIVYAQARIDEAIAACALERYWLENHAYPETLEEANRPGEKNIPPDPISGKPMGYRKTPNGRYMLWCVGWDGKGHGGERVLDKAHPASTKFYDPKYAGDWVWDYPAK